MLVAAPTGVSKTIVGEFAVHLALAQGKKAFYTTPIKALSNQKYQELVEDYGAARVGLLTGDTSVNSEADVVVMTTEVLRNMLYQDSSTLEQLRYVVMDEVHYLADRFRGAVWEEVIIHLPESVQVAALSATVSNAEEFGAWMDTVRGETAVVVSEHRPVPLWQHMVVDHQLYDLFTGEADEEEADDRQALVNPQLQRMVQLQQSPGSRRPGGHRGRGRPRRSAAGAAHVCARRRVLSGLQLVRGPIAHAQALSPQDDPRIGPPGSAALHRLHLLQGWLRGRSGAVRPAGPATDVEGRGGRNQLTR